MGDHNQGLAIIRNTGFQKRNNFHFRFGIQIACRLVSKNDSRSGGKSPGYGDPLLLASRQSGGQCFYFVRYADPFDNGGDKFPVRLFSVKPYGKYDIFPDVQGRHQIIVLKNKSDFSSAEYGKLFILQSEDIPAFHKDLS